MLSLTRAAQLLGGELSGTQVICPGPGHSPSDRSLSVRFHSDAPDGFIVHSFAADSFLACRDHVRRRLGIRRDHGDRFMATPPPRAQRTETRRDIGALGIWSEARNPTGTPVETYLAGRGLHLRGHASGAALRFHPACPFNGTRTRAMVALVRDIVTDRPMAIHRTAIALDGYKVAVGGLERRPKDRMALGPIATGAVKIDDEVTEVTTALGVGEGIESTLSLKLIPEFGDSPVWALLCAGNLERFPVLGGIDVLWIAVDNDFAGIEAAKACSSRWREAGREVLFVQPTVADEDLNDVAVALT
jgi:putative DNA primase/helicase